MRRSERDAEKLFCGWIILQKITAAKVVLSSHSKGLTDIRYHSVRYYEYCKEI